MKKRNKPMHQPRLLATAVIALLITSPAAAQTQDSESGELSQPEPNSAVLSAWGILGYGNGLGIGGRFMLPVVPEGFLQNDRIKDQLAAEIGVDLLRYSYSFLRADYGFVAVLPVAGLLWNVWVSDNLALYPKLDLGYAVGFLTGWNETWGSRSTYGGFFWQTSVGVLFKTRSVALRLELGNGLLKAGVGIGF
jgi:hypothetical protein